jgi:hypothetical protein
MTNRQRRRRRAWRSVRVDLLVSATCVALIYLTAMLMMH